MKIKKNMNTFGLTVRCKMYILYVQEALLIDVLGVNK